MHRNQGECRSSKVTRKKYYLWKFDAKEPASSTFHATACLHRKALRRLGGVSHRHLRAELPHPLPVEPVGFDEETDESAGSMEGEDQVKSRDRWLATPPTDAVRAFVFRGGLRQASKSQLRNVALHQKYVTCSPDNRNWGH